MVSTIRCYTTLVQIIILCAIIPLPAPITNLTNNDVYPMYSAMFQNDYLTRNIRYYYVDGLDSYCPERFQFSISPFWQTAKMGRDVCGVKTGLGNLTGRWNVPALFYPEKIGTPNETKFIQNKLFAALNPIGGDTINVETDLTTTCSAIINPQYRDQDKNFGFYDVNIKYRKTGLRFQFDFMIWEPIGMRVQTGFASIKQIPYFTDLTCSATGRACPVSSCGSPDTAGNTCCVTEGTSCTPNNVCIDVFGCYCKQIMIDKVMKQLQTITDTLNLNVNQIETIGWEDTRISLFFRKPFAINADRDDWHFFLCTPYVTLDVNAPTGKTPFPRDLFKLPLGNAGHWACGVTGGITFDFVKTVEIGFEGNVTKFFQKKFNCVPAPTNIYQAGLFPQTMNVSIDPGLTWNAAFSLNAYHFFSRLNIYVQYIMNGHNEDCFCISCPTTDPANISVRLLRENSKWESNVVNSAISYDISPNLALGFLWQAPVHQRNAYKSTTLLASIVGTF